MLISSLVQKLEALKEEHGDINVNVEIFGDRGEAGTVSYDEQHLVNGNDVPCIVIGGINFGM